MVHEGNLTLIILPTSFWRQSKKIIAKETKYPQMDIHFCVEITHSFQIVFDGFFNPIADKYLSIIEDKIQHEKVDFWKDFKLRESIFFFVKLNDHHCISNTQDFLIIKVSFILNICTNFDTWYYWGRISEIDVRLLMNWMADDFFFNF